MLPAPKDPRQNVRYRRRLLAAAGQDTELAADCRVRASRDFLWWCDTFLWTYSPKDNADVPDLPFISYDYQAASAPALIDSIGRHDMLGEKSRDMGMTWFLLAVIAWAFCYRRGFSALLGSRKLEYVDGDPRSLMWKVDYLLEGLPLWMRPAYKREDRHFTNLELGSYIDGEANVGDFGRGDRRSVILLDEFAASEEGDAIAQATRDTSNSRWFVSTPKGTNNAFYRLRQRMPKEQILRWHWTLHPEKAQGLYYDAEDRPRSPWYDKQVERAASTAEIAAEVDINYAESACQWFDQSKLDGLIAQYARDPVAVGDLVEDEQGIRFVPAAGGLIKLWCPVSHLGAPPAGEYGVGSDIATGKGGVKSSQSVASAVNRATGEKVAQLASRHHSPERWAHLVAQFCRWLNHAFLIWEDNGPGGQFTVELRTIGYTAHVYLKRDEKDIDGRKSTKMGWTSTRDSKRVLLGQYAESLTSGRFTNRDRAALAECGEYIRNPDGTIVHGGAKNDDPNCTGENHGDMVIADALANKTIAEQPVQLKSPEEREPPYGSIAWRRAERRRKELEEESVW